MSKFDTDAMYEIIADAPIGRYVGDRGARVFAEQANTVTFSDSTYVFKKGDSTKSFYIVAEGRLALVKVKKGALNKQPSIIHIFDKGDMVGELSFIDDEAHSSSVQALGDAVVMEFKADDIRPLILKEPQLMFDFMRAVIKRVHAGVKAVVDQQSILSEYIAGKGRT